MFGLDIAGGEFQSASEAFLHPGFDQTAKTSGWPVDSCGLAILLTGPTTFGNILTLLLDRGVRQCTPPSRRRVPARSISDVNLRMAVLWMAELMRGFDGGLV